MLEESDEFKDNLDRFLSQPDDNDQIDWVEGSRAGATDRLPVQNEVRAIATASEVSGIPIPQAATRAALEQVLKYAGDKVSIAVVAAVLIVVFGSLATVGAALDWLERYSKEEKKKD